MKYVIWKDRKEVGADLRAIYAAPTREEVGKALERFAEFRLGRVP